MFRPVRYIAWAQRQFQQIPFDLATSGVPVVSHRDVEGAPSDDPNDWSEARAAIARYNDISIDEVAPALGTSHGIFVAYASTTDPGDEILVETPGYEPLTRTAEGLGLLVRTFERRASEGYRLVPERVAAQLGPKTRAVVVTNLHNPTGIRAATDDLRELAAIMEARGGYVIVDEVYAPFDDLASVFPGSARKLARNVIAISSLTKCFGLGRYRIGWVLGPEEVIERSRAAIISTIGHFSLPHATHAVRAFEALPRLAERARNLTSGKRQLAEQWVSSLRDASWSAPREGLFGLVTLHGRGDLLERIETHARKSGVLVAAGSFFDLPESFRLSWASCDPERFEEALALLTPLAL